MKSFILGGNRFSVSFDFSNVASRKINYDKICTYLNEWALR